MSSTDATGPRFPSLATEAKIARRLGNPHIFAIGTTSAEQRREIVRAAITRNRWADAILGFNKELDRNETWAEAFERVYGVPL